MENDKLVGLPVLYTPVSEPGALRLAILVKVKRDDERETYMLRDKYSADLLEGDSVAAVDARPDVIEVLKYRYPWQRYSIFSDLSEMIVKKHYSETLSERWAKAGFSEAKVQASRENGKKGGKKRTRPCFVSCERRGGCSV